MPSIPPPIAFTGYAGTGKTTSASYLARALPSSRVLSFADPLRVALRAAFAHLPRAAFSEDKNREIPSMPGWSGRRLLQHVGTECFRAIDPEIWVKNMAARIEEAHHAGERVLIDDVRFPEEAALIATLGGALYRVERTETATLPGDASAHASESYVRSLPVTGVIPNHGSLPGLFHTLDALYL